MTTKMIVRGVLLLFVVGSLAYLTLKETGAAAEGPAGSAASVPGAPVAGGTVVQAPPKTLRHQVIAYYFHGQKRCNTCRAIQAQSKEALEAGFPEALMTGVLEFREVNTDESANEHFVTDYQLTGSSLVLAEYKDGKQVRFKNLGKVWDLWAEKPAFLAYVQGETRSWLEAP